MHQRRPLDIYVQTVPELIQKSLTDFSREDLYISIPATVANVDNYESKQAIDVIPVINDEYKDEVILRAPVLKSVFVKNPAGGKFKITMPIEVGDLVTLHYAHRNISDFLDGDGSEVDEPIDMVADLRDCWVTHGFGTYNNNQKPSQKDFIIEGPNTKIKITPDGEISIETTSTTLLKTTEYTVDSPSTIFTGDVSIQGTETVKGDVTHESNLSVGGDAEVTGISSAATMKATSSLTVAGSEMKNHTHKAGTPPGNTGVPN